MTQKATSSLFNHIGTTMSEDLKKYSDQLEVCMTQLDQGEIALIEFGDRSFKAPDYYTRIRIRLTKTPGGVQYGVRFVSTFRGEGSGAYFPRTTQGKLDAMQYVMKEVERYLKPSDFPTVKALVGLIQADLKFAGFPDESHIETPLLQRLHQQEEAEGRGFLPDAITIHLE
jgi:hypothetical protein